MDKLNITEGEWESPNGNNYCVISIKDDGDVERVVDHCKLHDSYAIVTAVNNTYKRGIDPEAVPDMKEALEEIVNAPDPYNERELRIFVETAKKLSEQALKKQNYEV